MRIPHTSKNATVVIARVASSAVTPTSAARATASVTLVPTANVFGAAATGHGVEPYHGESGFAHTDGPSEIIRSLAAVRGYAAQLASYAHESERVGRILDIVG